MPSGHRKKPFSNKQKKEQLKAKREQKKVRERDEFGNIVRNRKDVSAENLTCTNTLNKLGRNFQEKYDPNRYKLLFLKEDKDEIEKRKCLARKPFSQLPEKKLEMDLSDVHMPGSVLDMPKRPPWDYRMSKQQLEDRETRYFMDYLDNILEKYSQEELSYFELNLETWRQLWRVVEMADILLLITDIRHPALHFSPTFYNYVTKELKKPLVLVLNKIDVAPPSLVVAWKHYFQQKFPEVHIVCFTSFPKDQEEMAQNQNPEKLLHKKRKKRMTSSAVGPAKLFEVCETIVQGQVDLSSWKEKIEQEMAGAEPLTETQVNIEEESEYYQYTEHEKYKNQVLTIGCCGYPNVGKSSMINGLMGRKVVSVSKTPGHTKHFQTIFLTPSVKLCDCPGLVFPSLVPKPMQILSGIYPIAQVREPYTTVGYLAERIRLEQLLRLTHPDTEPSEVQPQWSAMDICEAWAQKRGFITAKAGRNDVYRAANNILRLALEGRLIMCTRPPAYTECKENWESHEEAKEIAMLQEMHRKAMSPGVCEDEGGDHLWLEEDCEDSDITCDSDIDEEGDRQHACEGAVGTSNPFTLLGGDH